MRRRSFIAGLGATALQPAPARAQQRRERPLIGWLGGSTREAAARNHQAFLQGLREHGYEVGKTVDVVYRWADGDMSLLPRLAQELVALDPQVIVSATTSNNVALMRTTATIPVVGILTVDPIGLGHAVSHNRPGRNFTGILMSLDGFPAKQAEVLFELLPRARTIGVLMNPDSATHAGRVRDMETVLGTTAIKVHAVTASRPSELAPAFETLKRAKVDGVVVLGDNMFFNEAAQIVSLAAATGIPAIHSFRQHVERGGLISYGVAIPQNFQRAGYFVDRILKGTQPGDLPIELPARIELVINAKAAKSLGIEIPLALLARADEVIE